MPKSLNVSRDGVNGPLLVASFLRIWTSMFASRSAAAAGARAGPGPEGKTGTATRTAAQAQHLSNGSTSALLTAIVAPADPPPARFTASSLRRDGGAVGVAGLSGGFAAAKRNQTLTVDVVDPWFRRLGRGNKSRFIRSRCSFRCERYCHAV
jgi:hypothetical protein